MTYADYNGSDSNSNIITTVATPRTVTGQVWYLDSCATTRITNDASKVVQVQPYDGLGRVVIGDDRSILISQIGSSFLNFENVSLEVNDALYVPQIHKNLLSTLKFTKDNSFYFEFYPIFIM